MSDTDVPAHGADWPTATPPGSGPQWPTPPADAPPPFAPQRSPATGNGYSGGRITSIVIGVLLVLVGVVSLGAGGATLWADLAARHDGYLTVAAADYRTSGSAMASDPVTLWGQGHLWYQASLVGDVHVTVTGADSTRPVFIGIAPAHDAEAYLAGAHYSTLTHLGGGRDNIVDHPGSTPLRAPTASAIWTASATGTGKQSLTWPSRDGTWMLVVTNADGSAPVSAHIDVGITAPSLVWISASLFAVAALFLTAGVLMIAIPMGRAARERTGATAFPTAIR